jgi:hypothetical protein
MCQKDTVDISNWSTFAVLKGVSLVRFTLMLLHFWAILGHGEGLPSLETSKTDCYLEFARKSARCVPSMHRKKLNRPNGVFDIHFQEISCPGWQLCLWLIISVISETSTGVACANIKTEITVPGYFHGQIMKIDRQVFPGMWDYIAIGEFFYFERLLIFTLNG